MSLGYRPLNSYVSSVWTPKPRCVSCVFLVTNVCVSSPPEQSARKTVRLECLSPRDSRACNRVCVERDSRLIITCASGVLLSQSVSSPSKGCLSSTDTLLYEFRGLYPRVHPRGVSRLQTHSCTSSGVYTLESIQGVYTLETHQFVSRLQTP